MSRNKCWSRNTTIKQGLHMHGTKRMRTKRLGYVTSGSDWYMDGNTCAESWLNLWRISTVHLPIACKWGQISWPAMQWSLISRLSQQHRTCGRRIHSSGTEYWLHRGSDDLPATPVDYRSPSSLCGRPVICVRKCELVLCNSRFERMFVSEKKTQIWFDLYT